MNPDIPAIVVLHGACAVVYALLAALILARPPLSRTGAWLAFACAATAVWAATFALAWHIPIGRTLPPGWRSGAPPPGTASSSICTAARSGSDEQVSSAFKTMGLLALLIVGGTPLRRMVRRPRLAPACNR